MHPGVMDFSVHPANFVPAAIRAYARAVNPEPGSATIAQIDGLPLARLTGHYRLIATTLKRVYCGD
jgi:hypothetical protein